MPTCSTSERHSTRSRLNGGAGSLFFDLHDSQWLSCFKYRMTAGQKIDGHTAAGARSTSRASSTAHDRWWVPGLTIGYQHTFVHAIADFFKGLESSTRAEPTFRTALATQRVCDAILRSTKSGQWVETGAAA